MSYTYANGQGIAALIATEPGAAEPMKVAAIAIRQIKAYLNDPTVGPAARIAAAEAAIVALEASVNITGTMPVGMIVGHGGDVATNQTAMQTAGYLYCDGRAVSRTEYKLLFDEIGTFYGAGDFVSTFNLPNFFGRIPVGPDNAAGIIRLNRKDVSSPLIARGDKTGTERVTLTVPEMATHSHVRTPNRFAGGIKGVYGGYFSSSPDRYKIFFNLEPTGGGASHNNLAPTLFVPFYIKYK